MEVLLANWKKRFFLTVFPAYRKADTLPSWSLNIAWSLLTTLKVMSQGWTWQSAHCYCLQEQLEKGSNQSKRWRKSLGSSQLFSTLGRRDFLEPRPVLYHTPPWKESICNSPFYHYFTIYHLAAFVIPSCFWVFKRASIQYETQKPQPLTNVAASRLDNDGTPAPSLRLHLGHALLCLLVGIISGTDSDFVLNAAKTIQLDAPITGKRRKKEELGAKPVTRPVSYNGTWGLKSRNI